MNNNDIRAEQINGYFNQEVPDDMLPDWMKDNGNDNEHSKLETQFGQRTEEKT